VRPGAFALVSGEDVDPNGLSIVYWDGRHNN